MDLGLNLNDRAKIIENIKNRESFDYCVIYEILAHQKLLMKCFHNNAHFESDFVESRPYFKTRRHLLKQVPHCSSEITLNKVYDLIHDSEKLWPETPSFITHKHLQSLFKLR